MLKEIVSMTFSTVKETKKLSVTQIYFFYTGSREATMDIKLAKKNTVHF